MIPAQLEINAHTWILIAIMFAGTFGLRLTPFVVRAWLADNETLNTLGRLMPVGVMVILVVYSFSGIVDDGLVPAVIGIVVTAALHLWRHQMLISIIGGVGAYGLALLLF